MDLQRRVVLLLSLIIIVIAAGIIGFYVLERARGLVITLPDERDNLFITVTARQTNPKAKIVARAADAAAEQRLKRAGADSVISPNRIGGMRMASEMLRPAVTTFLDTMLQEKKDSLRIEEVPVTSGSKLEGLTLGDVEIPVKTGLIVIAVKVAGSKKYIYNPHSSQKLDENDILIVLGSVKQVEKLRALVG